MESGDDGLESEANVRPRPCLTGAGSPGAQSTATDRGPSRDPLAQARLNRSAKGAGTGHSPRYPKCGTTQSDRLLVVTPLSKLKLVPPFFQQAGAPGPAEET